MEDNERIEKLEKAVKTLAKDNENLYSTVMTLMSTMNNYRKKVDNYKTEAKTYFVNEMDRQNFENRREFHYIFSILDAIHDSIDALDDKVKNKRQSIILTAKKKEGE